MHPEGSSDAGSTPAASTHCVRRVVAWLRQACVLAALARAGGSASAPLAPRSTPQKRWLHFWWAPTARKRWLHFWCAPTARKRWLHFWWARLRRNVGETLATFVGEGCAETLEKRWLPLWAKAARKRWLHFWCALTRRKRWLHFWWAPTARKRWRNV
jgi:hypothetical protein